ncbi:unnamed protein product [Trichogramma brassicae]|uniref:Reverse transcriptase domain-containing protein n=1 Tax=Trichogramma brassicae TaxID=86971 RepID=A0A6H5IQ08_9HYME|nr:unnamed protein product [Trichogramma brassicae]
MEKEFERRNVGGVRIGNTRIWSLAYADDIVILSKNREAMKDMLQSTQRFFKERQLELSEEKTKILIFNKRRNQKEEKWQWKEGYLEEVREFEYLGMMLNAEGNFNSQIRKLMKKGIVAAKATWGLGERRCREDYRRRMLLFKYLVQSVMSYGAELWGWNERKELEKVQMDYVRWVLRLDFCTPGYIIVRETGRRKMHNDWIRRAVIFERKCADAEEGRLIKKGVGATSKRRSIKGKKRGTRKTRTELQVYRGGNEARRKSRRGNRNEIGRHHEAGNGGKSERRQVQQGV